MPMWSDLPDQSDIEDRRAARAERQSRARRSRLQRLSVTVTTLTLIAVGGVVVLSRPAAEVAPNAADRQRIAKEFNGEPETGTKPKFDVVIANAGISQGMDSAVREDLAVLHQVMATNVMGMAATFHPFIQAMRERAKAQPGQVGGTLVGIASVAGIRGLPGHAAYCASKAAAISYCESLRGELGPAGVKVVTLAPGYIQTPLTAKNRFPMPFLMSAPAFAEEAFRAIERAESFRVIPAPMAWVARVLRVLPNALFDRAFKNQVRKQRGPD